MGAVIFIVDDAAIFIHYQFVAVPIGADAIAVVFGEIVRIDPEIVVEASAVLEDARRKVRVEGERDE